MAPVAYEMPWQSVAGAALDEWSEFPPPHNESPTSDSEEFGKVLSLAISMVADRLLFVLALKGITKGKLDAFSELEGVVEEAAEKRYTLPPDKVYSETQRLFWILQIPDGVVFSVYPRRDGDITLDAHKEDSFVMVVCEPDGTAFSIVDILGERSEKTYESTTSLPDVFVSDALRQLSKVRA